MILLTGAAGFIGFHTARRLLSAGREVVGVDAVNSYYDPALKRARLDILQSKKGFRFVQADLSQVGALERALPAAECDYIIHLAAQAGVRYSLEAPMAYEESNTRGHLCVLEYARSAPKLKHLVYASSSSVYGDRSDGPFKETDRCDTPASLYAATKLACELMSYTYAHLHGLRQTGLRFFTVYGDWGRPDMAYWSFTEKILRGEQIALFGEGKYLRDFTHVDDVAPAIIATLEAPPEGTPPHQVLNLGNSKPTVVLDLVKTIEKATGRAANVVLAPPARTEVTATFADHTLATARVGFAPQITIDEGIPRFVAWYRDVYMARTLASPAA